MANSLLNLLLVCATAACAASGSSSSVANADLAAQPQTQSDALSSADVAVMPCDVTAVAAVFDTKVRPHLNNCAVCHSIEGLKPMGAGPPWYSLNSAESVAALVELGMIAVPAPASPLVLAMIPEGEGGIAHKGGKRFAKADPAYADFIAFLTEAAPCVTVVP